MRGRKFAIDVARMLVVYLKRAGGQSQYSALLAAQAQEDSDGFSELEEWIVENLKTMTIVTEPLIALRRSARPKLAATRHQCTTPRCFGLR